MIQKQPTPAPAAKKKSAAKKKQAPVSPAAAAAGRRRRARPATQNPNSVYGAAGSTGAAERAYESAITPVNPQQLTPTNLQGFSSSATNITPAELTERQPRNLNEALTRVPGVIVINDDGAGHHGGIGMRGSPARRSRKMLVMEDGHTSNLALWLDPSVHYWAPADRIESLEVIRGTIITHGPNNNFGVINARALSPFGPDETVVSAGHRVGPSCAAAASVTGSRLQGRLHAKSPTAGTCTPASTPTTSASCCRTPAPTCRAPGIRSACASMTSTARSAGRASTTI